MTDWSSYREIADAGGRMPFNAAAIRSMLDEIDRLRAEREDARRWAVHLEGLLAREQAKVRSAEILTERAEGDRDRALQRLASASAENTAYRDQRDEVVAALGVALAVLDSLEPGDVVDGDASYRLRQADTLGRDVYDRYQRRALEPRNPTVHSAVSI